MRATALSCNLELREKVDLAKIYDTGKNNAIAGYGGTTTLLYNPTEQKVEKEFLSLAGTEWNCAGGVTPWGSWISCEETNAKAGGNYAKDHGYNFEVPARADSGLVKPVPLKSYGSLPPRSNCRRSTNWNHSTKPRTGMMG